MNEANCRLLAPTEPSGQRGLAHAIVLRLDEGASYREIEEQIGAFPSTISRWKRRYEKDGVLGLATNHPGEPPQKLTPHA